MSSPRKVRLGLTGGIGSGKSHVARLFGERGIPVIYADSEAKTVMQTDADVRAGLARLIGPDAVSEDSATSRRAIAAYLSASHNNAGRLNAIVHPAVHRHVAKLLEQCDSELCILECALLFEAGWDDLVDATICVTAPRGICLQRVMERDGTDRNYVERIMSLQMPPADKAARAKYLIDNDGTAPLLPQIEAILSAATHPQTL